MTGFIMFLHAFISILLIVVVLMQAGRGGGLTEGFASAESIFGARTNEFMIKTTTVMATVFFITCIGLAILSTQSGRSLMSTQVATETPAAAPVESAGEQETGLEVPQEAVSVNPEGTATAPEPQTPPQVEPVPAAPVTP